jgi:hypothetical protein
MCFNTIEAIGFVWRWDGTVDANGKKMYRAGLGDEDE